MQTHFQSWHKFTNIAWIDITLMSLLQYLDTFLSTLCTWNVRSSRRKEFFKKELFWKKELSTGVSFRKILGFCYRWKRQLFHYERTSLYVPLKILESANRIIFQTSTEFLLLSIPQQTKICSNSTTKECFRDFIRLSLYLAWKIFLKHVMESKFFKSSGLYINSSGGVSDGFRF